MTIYHRAADMLSRWQRIAESLRVAAFSLADNTIRVSDAQLDVLTLLQEDSPAIIAELRAADQQSALDELVRETERLGLYDDQKPKVDPTVWIHPNHLEHAKKARFLCAVTPARDAVHTVPLYAAPAPAQPRQPLSEWIACSDRLPEEGVHVLGYDPSLKMQLVAYMWADDHDIEMQWRDCTGDSWGDITHWQLLPADPIERAITGDKP